MTVSSPQEAEHQHTWTWIALAAAAAFGAFAVVYFLQRNPTYRLDRLLRQCEERIGDIEGSLAQLESTLSPPRA